MPDLAPVFAELEALMRPFAERLEITADDDANLSVDTSHVMENGKPLYFGGVQMRKSYVSYHLMPVYLNPSLLDDISPALRKRMQGKSCFSFTRIEPELLAELRSLTQRGYEEYRGRGYV
jgi:hypothetical protein